ncbi:MAG: heparinase II/III family protein [Candidatus Hydrogenedentes bacterium]|nr:heparinase II/III family protein [Candidatus Hydrogenedentota bacterium]
MKYSLEVVALCCAATGLLQGAGAQEKSPEAYIHAVVRGAGLMPWQAPGLSEAERNFRAEIEARKDELLARAQALHPSYYDAATIAQAKENVANHDWAKKWLDGQIAFSDEVVAQPAGWIAAMIPKEAPAHAYGFTCPECVGVKSQEGVGDPLVAWNYRKPDEFSCAECGTVFPNEKYPETQVLQLPRTGHAVRYYLNPDEQANPEDRSGARAWHWVGYPMHNSFSGIIRERKIAFMRSAVQSLGLAFLFTEDPRYAAAARDILVRFAECYRQWPYRDYWDTYADCDPLYAAWHDKALPIEWKRHLSEEAYKGDTMEKAAMLQNYWGAGRIHPSTDNISGLTGVVQAYDFTRTARHADGTPVWDDASCRIVERDLILEWAMGAEPYIGGPGKAEEDNNKSPRIYNAMAALGKCLGIPEYADVALRGYERVRDGSFLYDGFSSESPSYTGMYLDQLLIVPETLHGYAWPTGFSARGGVVDLYQQDPRLRLMYRSVLDTLLPDGRYLPLSDTRLPAKPSSDIVQMGARRYPEYFGGVLPQIHPKASGEYAVFNLTDEILRDARPLPLAEIYHPAWKTAVLRHGSGPDGDTLTLAFNPPGGHRHFDNLALFYADGPRTLAGDLGYLGDMPVNKWIRSTASHNLVIVDGAEQEFSGRKTEFGFMATSPLASVVEASSTAYPQCAEYRRRVVLVKLENNRSFAIDLFSVDGGAEHRYRAYSELASSDAAEGRLTFSGVAMPAETPLPRIGESLAEADIFGLRDVRAAAPEEDAWQATWQQDSGACRLWLDAPDTTVEASNGPGQRTHEEAGRRVRYVDAVRRGEALESRFAAVRESRAGDDDFLIQSVVRVPVDAGPDAIALQIETTAGTFAALNNFDRPTELGGFTFQGTFALLHRRVDGGIDALTVGAKFLKLGSEIVVDGAPIWKSAATMQSSETFTIDAEAPAGWSYAPGEARGYARVNVAGDWTGFPIERVSERTVTTSRFPAQPIAAIEIPAVTYLRGDSKP